MANVVTEMQKLNASIGDPTDKIGDPTVIGLLKKMANWKEEAKQLEAERKVEKPPMPEPIAPPKTVKFKRK